MENTKASAADNLFAQEFEKMVKQLAKSGGVTIEEHNRALLERAKTLLGLGYIGQDIYELLCEACEYHDLGKANPKMQERLKSRELKFDAEREIPHNVLSMYLMPKNSLPEYYFKFHSVSISTRPSHLSTNPLLHPLFLSTSLHAFIFSIINISQNSTNSQKFQPTPSIVYPLP